MALQKIIVAVVCLVSINTFAQGPTAAEIKAKRIKSITTITTYEDTATHPDKAIVYYDASGYDTARYQNDIRKAYKKILYNRKGMPSLITEYTANGDEYEKTTYTYKPDGSYTTKNISSDYNFITTGEYDKKGNLISLTLPDGSVKKHTYNNKGRLTKAWTIPKNGGVTMVSTYTYNTKGQLIAQKTTGDFPSTSQYIYSSEGLLVRSSGTYVMGGIQEKIQSTITYGY
jgi:YD repeat-containing protein